jgi:hypothetical protein
VGVDDNDNEMWLVLSFFSLSPFVRDGRVRVRVIADFLITQKMQNSQALVT